MQCNACILGTSGPATPSLGGEKDGTEEEGIFVADGREIRGTFRGPLGSKKANLTVRYFLGLDTGIREE